MQNAPLLLVTRDTLPAATAAELARLRPGRIVVLGSSGVVSDGVLAALRGYTGGSVDRIGGADRYATAAAISQSHFAVGPAVAYVATGTNFPDALAGAAVAGNLGGPLLLVTRDTIPWPTQVELTRLAPQRIVILGSTGVVSTTVGLALGQYETD
jgi:putative cell wall-binding protein